MPRAFVSTGVRRESRERLPAAVIGRPATWSASHATRSP